MQVMEPFQVQGLTLQQGFEGTVISVDEDGDAVLHFDEPNVRGSFLIARRKFRYLDMAEPRPLDYGIASTELALHQSLSLRTLVKGRVEHFDVQPPLPHGLELDATNGTISGKFQEASLPWTSFRIVASNPSGEASAKLRLRSLAKEGRPDYGFQKWHSSRLMERGELMGLGGVSSVSSIGFHRSRSAPKLQLPPLYAPRDYRLHAVAGDANMRVAHSAPRQRGAPRKPLC